MTKVGSLDETVVSEINIAGLPAITLQAGSYASGAPFGHRRTPVLQTG